jgi:hypothetical protein
MTITIDLDHEKRPLGELVEQTLGGTEIVITGTTVPSRRSLPFHRVCLAVLEVPAG